MPGRPSARLATERTRPSATPEQSASQTRSIRVLVRPCAYSPFDRSRSATRRGSCRAGGGVGAGGTRCISGMLMPQPNTRGDLMRGMGGAGRVGLGRRVLDLGQTTAWMCAAQWRQVLAAAMSASNPCTTQSCPTIMHLMRLRFICSPSLLPASRCHGTACTTTASCSRYPRTAPWRG
jgi:hypothetical protein